MKPTFQLKLGQPILPGLVVAGKFDGKTPSIVFATTGGKVVVHSPHHSGDSDGSLNTLRYLNLNRKITSIAAGTLSPEPASESNPDILFVGTQNTLSAYDVERNADIFFADVADGVNAIAVGQLSTAAHKEKMVFVGGNCSVLGFNRSGNESFWTVTGDNVGAMTCFEQEGGNGAVRNTLLVGSDDFEIRVFQNEESAAEITEADRPSLLEPLSRGRFMYALGNGTIGVYGQTGASYSRLWRLKTKHRPTALFGFDIDMDGQKEVFAGFANGQLTVRRADNGAVIHKETLDSAVAAIFSLDYRLDGKEEVIVCTESGSIFGYLPSDADFGVLHDRGIAKDAAADQKALDDLAAQKLELVAELKLVEAQLAQTTAAASSKNKPQEAPAGALPANATVTCALRAERGQGLLLQLEPSQAELSVSQVVLVDADSVLLGGADRDCLSIVPRPVTGGRPGAVVVRLAPPRHQPSKLRVQSHVSVRSLSSSLFVFDAVLDVPRFASLALLPAAETRQLLRGNASRSLGDGLSFSAKEPVERFVAYLQSAFLLSTADRGEISQQLQTSGDEERLSVGFESTSASSTSSSPEKEEAGVLLLTFRRKRERDRSAETTNVQIQCVSMDLAGQLFQDLAKYFSWSEVSSVAHFPREFTRLEEHLQAVQSAQDFRHNLSADMAEESARVKALVVRAEDSRLLGDMTSLRRSYTELKSMNFALQSGYRQRSDNHNALVAALKEVNSCIQQAAQLRLGGAKQRVITDSRQAVKSNRVFELLDIFRKGFDSTVARQDK